MARIRSIKPELPQDERLARLSRVTRLHFVYLLTVADDEGFFRAMPRLLLGLYPHDRDVGEGDVDRMTAELVEAGLLVLHQSDDGPIGQFRNWHKHQKIDHPSGSYLKKLIAKPSRKPREEVAKGVLSLESLVLSPDQGQALVVGSTTGAPSSQKPVARATNNETPGAKRHRSAAQGNAHIATILPAVLPR